MRESSTVASRIEPWKDEGDSFLDQIWGSGVNLWRFVKVEPGRQPRDPVPRARNQAEQLGYGEDEIEYLGYEEQKQGLGEMGLNSDNCKSHSSQIAESVAWECACGVP